MKLVEARFLRGPNLHGMSPCYVAVIDLEALAGMQLADLERETALPRELQPIGDVGDVGDMAGLVARLTDRLQALVDCAATPGSVSVSAPRHYRLVFGYAVEAVAAAALMLSIDLVNGLAEGRPIAFESRLSDLRRLATAGSIDAASQALLDAARAHDIPVLRLDNENREDRRFQLGWGALQRQLVAGPPDANTAAPNLESLFPPGATGRIPVVAITGTNGKTTTTLLIAHALRAGGARVGSTTTQGIFIDGRCVEQGDCTGYWSARRVLTDAAVDMAVLETARGGILKRGLAFDRCDVGVVLNVSGDHLGLDGIETVADLAHVKGLIARCASTAAVLNAEDEHCVRMRQTLRDGCAPVYFAMDPNQAVIREHLQSGGSGAYLEDGWLVWSAGGRPERVVEAARLPVTLHGHARHNVANALAAVAALRSMGQPVVAIAAGLSSFVSNAKSNPLRGNQFQVGDVRLIVDYAHNVVAYRALCSTARSLLQGRGRLIGVVTSPGDRRTTDLYETGQVCGDGFDELVVYEQHPRGRSPGETVQVILDGARSVAATKPLLGEPQMRQALARGLAVAQAGDILVCTCAGPWDELVDAVRQKDADAAQRIAMELAE